LHDNSGGKIYIVANRQAKAIYRNKITTKDLCMMVFLLYYLHYSLTINLRVKPNGVF